VPTVLNTGSLNLQEPTAGSPGLCRDCSTDQNFIFTLNCQKVKHEYVRPYQVKKRTIIEQSIVNLARAFSSNFLENIKRMGKDAVSKMCAIFL
jgi:hypothetical protein